MPKLIPYPKKVVDRFKLFYTIGKPEDCWLWRGSILKRCGGYGTLKCGRKFQIRAHRLAKSIHLGRKLKSNEYVCHKCDVPSCVNPNHLFVSDQLGNMRDCVSKGRNARGERMGTSKLKETEVLAIIRLWNSGYSNKSLTKLYNVSQSCIWRITHNQRWSHLCQS